MAVLTLKSSEGEINELRDGPRGTTNSPFLKDLAAKTRTRRAAKAGRASMFRVKSGSGLFERIPGLRIPVFHTAFHRREPHRHARTVRSRCREWRLPRSVQAGDPRRLGAVRVRAFDPQGGEERFHHGRPAMQAGTIDVAVPARVRRRPDPVERLDEALLARDFLLPRASERDVHEPVLARRH
ncbi:MAG: hypothetical protein OXD36_17560 [Rhodobacter sp.]|nr:hypothetical protein [Rhodobacter sp.]